jgi:hypothetical protein
MSDLRHRADLARHNLDAAIAQFRAAPEKFAAEELDKALAGLADASELLTELASALPVPQPPDLVVWKAPTFNVDEVIELLRDVSDVAELKRLAEAVQQRYFNAVRLKATAAVAAELEKHRRRE